MSGLACLDPRRMAELLRGDFVGRDNLLVPGPGHSSKDRSLSIRLVPTAPGGFLVHSFAGDDPMVCKEHVRQSLGLQRTGAGTWRPRRKPRTKALRKASRGRLSAASGADARDRLSLARSLWRRSTPIEGTPAEKYLRGRRCNGALPATLRFLAPRKREHHPAMIAAFCIPDEPEPGRLEIRDEQITGVHLTLIASDGNAKAGTGRDKFMIGSSSGSPIVLAPPNDLLALAICEGIEDALSLHQVTCQGAWAAGSAGRLPALADVVPKYIDCVTIIADADDVGLKNAKRLASELNTRGLYVEVKSPEQD